jgi:hypothetical protein
MNIRPLLMAFGGCAALLLSACASTPPPTAELAASNAAIAHAAGTGANEIAPKDMLSARSKLESAQIALNAKDYDRARTLSDEAQADARLAEARTLSSKARKAADAVQDDHRVLREELDRKPK